MRYDPREENKDCPKPPPHLLNISFGGSELTDETSFESLGVEEGAHFELFHDTAMLVSVDDYEEV